MQKVKEFKMKNLKGVTIMDDYFKQKLHDDELILFNKIISGTRVFYGTDCYVLKTLREKGFIEYETEIKNGKFVYEVFSFLKTEELI